MQALSQASIAGDPAAEKQLVQLLSIPLDSYDVVTVLGLAKYPSVMSLLQPTMRKASISLSVPFCCW